MTPRNTRTTTTARIGAAFAAITTTTLILGSQLGLAGHYTTEADAVLAAKRAAPVAHNSAGSAARQPGART
jgi:hypothetical protein